MFTQLFIKITGSRSGTCTDLSSIVAMLHRSKAAERAFVELKKTIYGKVYTKIQGRGCDMDYLRQQGHTANCVLGSTLYVVHLLNQGECAWASACASVRERGGCLFLQTRNYRPALVSRKAVAMTGNMAVIPIK